MSNQETANAKAKELFDGNLIDFQGQGFYRYLEPISDDMISRKGLEREASEFCGHDLTLVTRHDVENNVKVRAYHRVAILQVTADYEADQVRAMENKAKKLQTKYAK